MKIKSFWLNPFVRVGNMIPSKEFDTFVSSIREDEAQSFASEIRIEEEEDDTQKKWRNRGIGKKWKWWKESNHWKDIK